MGIESRKIQVNENPQLFCPNQLMFMFNVSCFFSMHDNQFHGYRRWLNSEISESHESTGLFSLIAGRPQRYTMLVNRFRFQLYKIHVIQIHCIPFSDISIHTCSQFLGLLNIFIYIYIYRYTKSSMFVGDHWILPLQGFWLIAAPFCWPKIPRFFRST